MYSIAIAAKIVVIGFVAAGTAAAAGRHVQNGTWRANNIQTSVLIHAVASVGLVLELVAATAARNPQGFGIAIMLAGAHLLYRAGRKEAAQVAA